MLTRVSGASASIASLAVFALGLWAFAADAKASTVHHCANERSLIVAIR